MTVSPFRSCLAPVAITALAALLAGCNHDKEGDDTDTAIGHDSGDTSTTEDTGDIDTGVLPGVHGTVEGTVYLQLYTTDEAGDMVLMDWDETYGGYPFGSVFVAAYTSDEDGYQTYYDQHVITSPTVSPAPGGDPYGLDIDVDDIDSVNIFASVDYVGDGIIGTGEPTGAFPNEVTVTSNGTVTEVDITVMVPYAGTGGGGGGCTDVVNISGTATVGSSWVEGDVAALLYDTNGAGPYTGVRATPTATSGGAEAAYDLPVCANYGDYQLLGAWDSNGNGLFDPADTWGSYVIDDSTDGNPIAIREESLPDHDILIPFGEYHPTVVPFVSISGTLTSDEDWSTYSDVYVAALKYRPQGDTSVADLKAGYDIVEWSTTDLAASSELDFHVEVPANTIIYLWAYADIDGDGILNEVADPVASLNDSTGRTVTGSTSQSGQDLVLTVP